MITSTEKIRHLPLSDRFLSQTLFSRALVWTMRVLCLTALVVTGYLTWLAFTSSKTAGCGGGWFDCEHVFQSRWSKWFFLPVSVPAFAIHLTAFVALASLPKNVSGAAPIRRRKPRGDSQQLSWRIISLCVLTAGLVAIWFIGLQLFVIQRLCVYCLAAHACALAMAGMVLWRRPAGAGPTFLLGAGAAALAAIFVGGQLLTPAPVTYEIQTHENRVPPDAESEEMLFEAPVDETSELDAPESETSFNSISSYSPSRLALHGLPWLFAWSPTVALSTPATVQESTKSRAPPSDGKQATGKPAPPKSPKRRLILMANAARLDVRQWPLVGSPDAKYVFVEMLDYTCPHCRNTQPAIRGAFKHYGDKLALIVLPTPLNAACNDAIQVTNATHSEACELARLAVAVWRVKPEKFPAFHDWMLSGNQTRTYAQAWRYAARLVGDRPLRVEWAKPVAAKYIAKNVQLYKRAGAGAVPKLLFPKTSLVGQVSSSQTVIDLIERQSRAP